MIEETFSKVKAFLRHELEISVEKGVVQEETFSKVKAFLRRIDRSDR